MIDYKWMRWVEKNGYVNDNGKRVYGTAALNHVLHTNSKAKATVKTHANTPILKLTPRYIKLGKEFISKCFSA